MGYPCLSLVISTQRLHPNDQPLAEGIHIAPDGEAVHCLGSWIGNNINHAQPWSPIIDKIQNTLKNWNRDAPHS